jgi:probable biosynthetic protein (TIGR04098 family)
MTRAEVDREVLKVVADVASVDAQAIDPARWVTHYGVDSLQLIVLRETLESAFQLMFTDEEWLRFTTVRAIIDHIQARGASGPPLPSSTAVVVPPPVPGDGTLVRYASSGLLHAELEVGMPLMGRNNLGEGPLLQRLGDLRWGHLSHLCGARSRDIVNAEGARLYPTFFFVDLAFPRSRPLASYGENDRIRVCSDLRRFGSSMLDGTFYFLPPGHDDPQRSPFEGPEVALRADIPSVRLSNIFVMMFSGAEWLKKSRPANPGFQRIPESPVAPDSYELVKQAERDGRFSAPPGHFLPMTDGPVTCEYRLIPDRDLNGAGLVYFANYPVFLDICERQVLGAAELPLTEELLDQRTLVRRRSAYLNNASARDVLAIEVEPFVEPGGPAAPIRLFINYRMRRRSDGRIMMVSTAEKVITSRRLEETPFWPRLARQV